MAAAALATGNTVVLKPAEQSPGCGYEIVRALREAGVPPGRSRSCPARATSAPRWSSTPRSRRSRSPAAAPSG
jgi:acyl-CoA reductase-like NAD-dependent aldehyde dehydrogenase